MTLTGGRYYRIRGQHKQGCGSAHFTVSLEAKGAFKQVNGADHPKGMREVQAFEINQDQVPEQWQIEITPDHSSTGGWFLSITKSDGNSILVPEKAEDNFMFDISCSTLAYHLRKDYFNKVVGSTVTCNRVMYDEFGVETSTFTDSAKIVFTL